jgi:Chitobiase/beta-hexosaminidase C-terminal domain/Fn3 associated
MLLITRRILATPWSRKRCRLTASTKYAGPIAVSQTTPINAIAVASNYANSAVASATYTIMLPAATPVFSCKTGTYATAQTVTITDATKGAVIYYTTNGATPTTASTRTPGLSRW